MRELEIIERLETTHRIVNIMFALSIQILEITVGWKFILLFKVEDK